MGSVIGEMLPLALGIALSPPPIIAVVLMLLSPNATATSISYMAGWLVGITTAVLASTLLFALLPDQDPDESAPIAGAVKLILGAGLVLLAYRKWRNRPSDGSEPALPSWMEAINTLTAIRALGFGFLLSAFNPKNILLAGAAGVAVGASDLSTSGSAIAMVIFILLATASVTLPVIAYRVAGPAMDAPLREVHGWLLVNNTTIMAVLMLVIGVSVIGQGLGSF